MPMQGIADALPEIENANDTLTQPEGQNPACIHMKSELLFRVRNVQKKVDR
jgi:hypothetical protein